MSSIFDEARSAQLRAEDVANGLRPSDVEIARMVAERQATLRANPQIGPVSGVQAGDILGIGADFPQLIMVERLMVPWSQGRDTFLASCIEEWQRNPFSHVWENRTMVVDIGSDGRA